jgi:hypothetical protein
VRRTTAQPASDSPGRHQPFPHHKKWKITIFRAAIFGIGREVAISCSIRILFQTTTFHDLSRTVLLAPLLD